MGAGLLRWQQSAVFYTGQRRGKSRMTRDAPRTLSTECEGTGLENHYVCA